MKRFTRMTVAPALLVFQLAIGFTGAEAPASREAPIAPHQQPVVTLALVGGNLIDGYGGLPLRNSVVLVSGNTVSAIGRVGQLELPPGARVLDTNGMTVLPGLWESHGHLFHAGAGKPGEFQRHFSDRALEVMASVAETSLQAGITSFRDTGGPLEPQQKLRREIDSGKRKGPRLFLAGPIMRQGAAGSEDPFTVSSPEQARQVARGLISRKVDQIKVYGFWDEEVLRAVVETAHQARIGVDADVRHIHAYLTAVRAGVDRLHHVFTADPLSDYSQEDIRLLVRGVKPVGSGPSANILRGPYILPTIQMRQAYSQTFASPERIDHPGPWKYFPADVADWILETIQNPHAIPWGIGATERVKVAKRKLRRFIEMGGREQIVAGCDAGSPLNFHSPLAREIGNLAEAGLTAMEAIQSATLRPAQMQGVADRLGTVTAGKLADMIVVDGDPLSDIRLLEHRIVHVVKNGAVIR